MYRSNLLDNIADHAAYFAWKVDGRMSAVHYDINIDAEQSLIPILNVVYGVELINANKLKNNFPAVDLVDVKKRVAFQITGTATQEKILNTIRKFVKYKLYEQFPTLYIYILTRKSENYNEVTINAATHGKFNFDIKINIIDFKDIISHIRLIESIDILASIEKCYQQLTTSLEAQWKRTKNKGAGSLSYLNNVKFELTNIIAVENIDKVPQLSDQFKKITLLQELIVEKEKEMKIFGQAFEQHLYDKDVIEILNSSYSKLKNEYAQLKEDLEREKEFTDTLTTYIKEQKKLLDQEGRLQVSERMQKARKLFEAGELKSVDELLNYEGRQEFISKKLEEKREQSTELLALADEEVFLALSMMQNKDWNKNIHQIKVHFENSIELGGYGNNSYLYSLFLENNKENELALDILKITLVNTPKDQMVERAKILERIGYLLEPDNTDEALRSFREAADIYDLLYEKNTGNYGIELAENLYYTGALLIKRASHESKRYFERSLLILSQIERFDNVKTMKLKYYILVAFALLYEQQGDVEYTDSYLRLAVEAGATLAFDDPDENISYLLDAVSRIRSLVGKGDDTIHTLLIYKMTLGRFLKFHKEDTAEKNYANAVALSRIGLRLLTIQEIKCAEVCFRNALKIFRILYRKGFPCLSNIAEQLRLVAIKFKLLNDSKRVERYLHEAIQIRRQLAGSNPEENLPDLASLLAELYIQSFVAVPYSEFYRSSPYFEEALSIYKNLDLGYGKKDMDGWVLLLRNRSMLISREIDKADPVGCYQELNYLKSRMTPQQTIRREEDLHTIANELADLLLDRLDPDHPLFVQIATDIILAKDYFYKSDPEKYKISLFISLSVIASKFADKKLWKEAFPNYLGSIAMAKELALKYPEIDKKWTIMAMSRLASGYLEVEDYSNCAYWFSEQYKFFKNRLTEHPDEVDILISSICCAAEAYLLNEQVEIASEYIIKGKIHLPLVLEPSTKARLEEHIERLGQKIISSPISKMSQ